MELRQWLRGAVRYHATFVLLVLITVPWDCCT